MALYYKPGPMTEGIRNIIQGLLQEYNIESAADIQEALKDLLGGTIKEMMEAEMDEHLGYEKSERSDSDDARNGYIAAAYPQTEYQRCIVHQVRNTLKYVSDKDRKAFANDLKMIYNAPSEQEGREALESDLFSSTYSHVKSAKKQEASLPIIRRECLLCIDYSQMPAIILLNLQSLAVPVKEHYLFSHAFGKAVDVFCNNGVIHQENPHLSWDESAQRETTSYSFFSQAAGRERIALITAGSNLALRL